MIFEYQLRPVCKTGSQRNWIAQYFKRCIHHGCIWCERCQWVGWSPPPGVERSAHRKFLPGSKTVCNNPRDAQIPGLWQTALLYNQAQINDNKINPQTGFTPGFPNQTWTITTYRRWSIRSSHNNWKDILFKNFSKRYRANFDNISGGTERVKYFYFTGWFVPGRYGENFSKAQDISSHYHALQCRSNLDIKSTNTDLRLDADSNIGEINTPNVGKPLVTMMCFITAVFLSLAPFNYPVYNPNGSYGYSNWRSTAVVPAAATM